MNCNDFQTNLDSYLDGELDSARMPAAASHVGRCRSCDHVVTDHQKARALLITAVTDRVAAVDVSGLWNEINRRLDEPQPNVTMLAAFRARRSLRTPRFTAPRAAALQAGAFATAAVAAALVFSLFTGDRPAPQQLASKPTRVTTTAASIVPTGTGVIQTGTGGMAQSRRVRIDRMDVGAGHTVSTWVKPRTKTRVIWVASSNSAGYGVASVNQTR